MTGTGRIRRLLQGTVGAALVALGLTGLAWAWQGPAAARPASRGPSHEVMHDMMEAMHGEGTAARLHRVEGVDEMMDQCAAMMDAMGGRDMSGMDEMMRDGGMMGTRSDDRGMGGMMGDMMGRR